MVGEAEAPDAYGAHRRVVVIDDDARLCAAAERALRHLGYSSSTATVGEDGLRSVLEHPPDAILVDIRMPRLDGHTLLRRLRAHGVGTGVVVMSGHATLDDAIDALRNGAVDFLKKPWTMPELAAAVARAIERTEMHEALVRAGVGVGAPATHGALHDLAPPPAPAPAREDVSSPTPVPLAPFGPLGARAEPSVPEGAQPGRAGSAADSRPDVDGGVFRGLVASVRDGAAHLPPLPAVLGELRRLVYSAEASVGRVSSLIERDQALTAELLRITSSAAFATRQPTMRGAVGVRSAVVRVGLAQIQSLVETLVVRRMFSIQTSRLRPMASRVWRGSIARAMSMRALASLAALAGVPVEPETAYLAGLLADSGASYLLWFADERASEGAHVDAPSSLEAIHALHVELGVEVLSKYDVDPVILSVARTHHRRVSPVPTSPYWHLSTVSSSLVSRLVPGGDVTHFEGVRPELLAESVEQLRIDPIALAELMVTLPDDLKAFVSSLT